MQRLRRQLLTGLASPISLTRKFTCNISLLTTSQALHCQSQLFGNLSSYNKLGVSALQPSASHRSSDCLLKQICYSKRYPCSLATKAEDYDLIVAEAGLVRIEGYDDTGFIVNDIQVQGAVFCIADLTTVWKVQQWDEVSPESLSMLQLFKPAPDLVILGCGSSSQMVPPALQSYFRQHNIAYEAIDTANAVSTFNILNQEGRKVAGCLLPAGAS